MVEDDEEEDREKYEIDASGLLPDELALEFDDDEEELEECEPPLSLGFNGLVGLATTVFSPKPIREADSDDHDDWHLTSGVRRGDGVKAATGEIKSAAAMAEVREIVDFIVNI